MADVETTYPNYRAIACAIIHSGVTQYKKALWMGTNLEVTREYLNNRFYQMLVRLILDSTVDEMLNNVAENYEYTKEKRYNRGILYGGSRKHEKYLKQGH